MKSILTSIGTQLKKSGLSQINKAIDNITNELLDSQVSLIDQAILQGQLRELKLARWIVNQLPSSVPPQVISIPIQPELAVVSNPEIIVVPPSSSDDLISISSLKLQNNLSNLTSTPLEIDILREDKKRLLLNLILQKFNSQLTELQQSQVTSEQLPTKRSLILLNLWTEVIEDFLGRYFTLSIQGKSQEIVPILLKDAPVIETEVLDNIPLVCDLLSHLLYQDNLKVDNDYYSLGSPQALERAEIILQNLIIQIGNGVVQALLNNLAHEEFIKQNFYNQQMLSTREIEKFRNNLSWRTRLNQYIIEPQAIFESKYILYGLNGRGIAKATIYAPRNQELQKLTGLPYAVTLLLEIRDAIAPRLRTIVAFIGSGLIYILTQVIGRAIGLIAKGIIQGIGISIQDIPFVKSEKKLR